MHQQILQFIISCYFEVNANNSQSTAAYSVVLLSKWIDSFTYIFLKKKFTSKNYQMIWIIAKKWFHVQSTRIRASEKYWTCYTFMYPQIIPTGRIKTHCKTQCLPCRLFHIAKMRLLFVKLMPLSMKILSLAQMSMRCEWAVSRMSGKVKCAQWLW